MINLTKNTQVDSNSKAVQDYYSKKAAIYRRIVDNNVSKMEQRVEHTKNTNGYISSIICRLLKSDKKSKEIIDNYKNEKISFKKAQMKLECYTEYPQKALDYALNIVAYTTSSQATDSIVTIMSTSGDSFSSAGICIVGAATGALVKTGIKLADRATNKTKDSALNPKKLKKDSIAGAKMGFFAQLKTILTDIWNT